MELDDIHFVTKKCSELTNQEINQCADLFSNHYGIWGKEDPKNRSGQRIKLSAGYYEKFKRSNNHYVSLAYHKNDVVGQAFYIRKKVDGFGYNSWVIQIVVNSKYRRCKIGRTLLYSIWGFSDDSAWGLATANPYTVQTLESATFRRVLPEEIYKHLDQIKELGKNVAFVEKYLVNKEESLVDTGFFIDQSKVPEDIKTYQGEWELGTLKPGHEWLAFTFQDQPIEKIPERKFNELIAYSEKQLKSAYGRMNPEQAWTKFTSSEVDCIINKLKLSGSESILDFGCGRGRHSLEFASRGYNAIGVDFVISNIKYAKRLAKKKEIENIEFRYSDCRKVNLGIKGQLAICLYDVIGSFPNEFDNIMILQNIYKHLEHSAYAVISVMNMELTKKKAKYKTDIYKNPRMLMNLKPSNIMQNSGDIFDPEYFIIDEKTNLVFRKEQFQDDGNISAEYVIRDKRYTAQEICTLVEKIGFKVIEYRFVQAGKWGSSLNNTDLKAKEILLFLQKY